MKKLLGITLSILIFSFTSTAKENQGKKEPIFLAVVKGNSITYIDKAFQKLNLKIKDTFYHSVAYYAGFLYITQNYKDYADFYVNVEAKILKNLKDTAKKNCKKYLFYMFDNFNISITNIREGNILLVATCNIICMDLK